MNWKNSNRPSACEYVQKKVRMKFCDVLCVGNVDTMTVGPRCVGSVVSMFGSSVRRKSIGERVDDSRKWRYPSCQRFGNATEEVDVEISEMSMFRRFAELTPGSCSCFQTQRQSPPPRNHRIISALVLRPMAHVSDLFVFGLSHNAPSSSFFATKATEKARQAAALPWCETLVWVLFAGRAGC